MIRRKNLTKFIAIILMFCLVLQQFYGASLISVKAATLSTTDIKTSFGGSGNDVFTSFVKSDDGGFVAVGSSNSTDGDMSGRNLGTASTTDAIVVKYSSTGSIVWSKVYGGSGNDGFNKIIKISDGYLVAGFSSSTANNLNVTISSNINRGLLTKLDTSGNVVWSSIISTSGATTMNSVMVNGSYIYAVGTSFVIDGDLASPSKGGFLVKYDLNGNKQGVTGYGVTSSYNNVYGDLVYNTNNNFIYISGSETTDGSNYQNYVYKFNTSLSYIGYMNVKSGSYGYNCKIAIDASGNVVTTGSTTSSGASGVLGVNNASSGSNLLYLNPASSGKIASYLIDAEDGYYTMSSYAGSGYLHKYNTSWAVEWSYKLSDCQPNDALEVDYRTFAIVGITDASDTAYSVKGGNDASLHIITTPVDYNSGDKSLSIANGPVKVINSRYYQYTYGSTALYTTGTVDISSKLIITGTAGVNNTVTIGGSGTHPVIQFNGISTSGSVNGDADLAGDLKFEIKGACYFNNYTFNDQGQGSLDSLTITGLSGSSLKLGTSAVYVVNIQKSTSKVKVILDSLTFDLSSYSASFYIPDGYDIKNCTNTGSNNFSITAPTNSDNTVTSSVSNCTFDKLAFYTGSGNLNVDNVTTYTPASLGSVWTGTTASTVNITNSNLVMNNFNFGSATVNLTDSTLNVSNMITSLGSFTALGSNVVAGTGSFDIYVNGAPNFYIDRSSFILRSTTFATNRFYYSTGSTKKDPLNKKGDTVFLNMIKVPTASNSYVNTSIDGGTVSKLLTDSNGYLYLYLPIGTHNVHVTNFGSKDYDLTFLAFNNRDTTTTSNIVGTMNETNPYTTVNASPYANTAIEYSFDKTTWTPITTDASCNFQVIFPAGKNIIYIRIDGVLYSAVVDAGSGTANSTILTPTIVTQSTSSVSLLKGHEGSLFVTATPSQTGNTLTYQWSKDGTPIPAAISQILVLSNPQDSDKGTYICTVTENGLGTVNSAPITVDVLDGSSPAIDFKFVGQSSDKSLIEGYNTDLIALAQPSDGVTYQWYKDAVAVSGASIYKLSIVDAKITDAGAYYCQASDGTSTINSNIINVTVSKNPLGSTVTDLQGQVSDLSGQVTILQGQLTAADTTISTLSDTITGLQTNITNLNGQITSLQNDIAALQSSNDDKDTQIASLTTQLSTVTGQRDALQTQVTNLQSDKAALEIQITNLNSDITNYLSQITTLQNALSASEDANTDLSSQLAALQATLLTLQGQISDLQSQIADLTNQNATLTSQLSTANDTITSLQQTIASLNGQVTDLQGQVTVLQGQVDSLTTQLTTSQNTVTSLTSQNNDLLSNISDLNTQISDLQQQVADLIASGNSNTADLLSQISALTSQRDNLQTQLDNANAQISSLQDTINGLNGAITGYLSQITGLQSAYDASENDNAALRQQILDLQSTLSALQNSYSDLSSQIAALQGQVLSLTTDLSDANNLISSLQSQIIALQNQNASLLDQLNTAEQALDSLQSQLDTQIAVNTSLQNQVDSLTTDLNKALNDLQDEKNDKDALTAQVASLQSQVDTLTQQLLDSSPLIAQLNETINTLNATISNLQSQINAALSQLSEYDGATLLDKITDIKSKQANIATDLQSARNSNTSLTNQLNALNSQLVYLQGEVDRLNGVLSDKDAEIARLNTLLQESNGKISDLITDNNQLKAENDSQKKQIEDLKKQLSEVPSTGTSGNTSNDSELRSQLETALSDLANLKSTLAETQKLLDEAKATGQVSVPQNSVVVISAQSTETAPTAVKELKSSNTKTSPISTDYLTAMDGWQIAKDLDSVWTNRISLSSLVGTAGTSEIAMASFYAREKKQPQKVYHYSLNVKKPLSVPTFQMNKLIYIGSNFNLNLANVPKDATVTYTSSDKTIARVNSSGTIIPVKEGSATITGKVTGKNPYEFKIKVTVKEDDNKQTLNLKEKTIKASSDTPILLTYKLLDKGQSTKVSLSGADGAKTTYISSDSNVVSVLQDGTLVGKSKGFATVTAILAQNDIIYTYIIHVRVTDGSADMDMWNYLSVA